MTEPTAHRDHLVSSETCDWCEEPAVDTAFEVVAPKYRGRMLIEHAITASVCEAHREKFTTEKRERERREASERREKSRSARQRKKRRGAWAKPTRSRRGLERRSP
jgi:hypothetical protein